MVLKGVYYVHRNCIYLIKKYSKNCNIVKYYYNLKYVFYVNLLSNLIYFWDEKLNFQIITPVFSVTW